MTSDSADLLPPLGVAIGPAQPPPEPKPPLGPQPAPPGPMPNPPPVSSVAASCAFCGNIAFLKFGITDILPARPLDVLHDQLIPGRARVLEHFAALERYPGNVAAIDGSTVVMADGQRLDDIDVLLWFTGYATDLSYIDVPSLAARSLKELGARCGGGFRSLDAANLYFPGVGLDGIGSAPRASYLMARTIVSHIRGTARLDMAPVPHRLNHFDLVTYLAPRDPGSFVPGKWREQFRKIAMETADEVAYPMR